MKTIPLLTLLLCGTVAFGQPESCLEATPFQYFHCESFNPATTPSATLCYQFHTSGTAVDFSFGYFAYCPTARACWNCAAVPERKRTFSPVSTRGLRAIAAPLHLYVYIRER